MYQSTATQAFEFCQKYTRKTEFRRLCELLRNHVQTAAKYSTQMHAINLSDPDTLQRHLETRFQQLNVAVELELWQEAFRSVEDIHTLLNLSKRPPKNIMMANYYEKLTRIFLVGENYLFHAAAWSRYYNLLHQSSLIVAKGVGKKSDNPAATDADLTNAASFVLLSALAIPVISTSRSRGALIDTDDARKSKNSRLTHLLGMSQAPTRAVLFKDAMSKGLLKRVRPEIRELYNILEVDFHPLEICKKINPVLEKIAADPEMEKYVLPLQQVILTRLFQQLSQAYETVDLSYVQALAVFPAPFEVSKATIEKFIMNGNKKGDLAIRMDHATGVLSFDNDVFSASKAVGSGAGLADESQVQKLQNTPSEIVSTQLSRLARSLYVAAQYIDPSFNAARVQAQQAAYARAQAGAAEEHRETLARKQTIQTRKEQQAELSTRKEREEAIEKRRRVAELQELEDQRLAREQKDREAKRVQAELDRVRKDELKKQIADLKLGSKAINLDGEDLENLDSNRLRAIKLQQLETEKNDTNKKLRVTGKRLDHLERASRKEEAKKLPEDYEQQKQRDREAYEKTKAQILRDAEAKHAEDLELSKRLTRLLSTYEGFSKEVKSRRHEQFEKSRRDAEKELEKQVEARRKEHRAAKLRERQQRAEQERLLREEEERAAKEAEEKAARQEREREKLKELKAQREKERAESAAKIALQQQREEEAMARRKEAKASGGFTRTELPTREAAGRAPALPLAGAKMGWREKEALRAAGQEVPGESAPTERAAPPARTENERPRYTAPSARGDGPTRTDSNSERPRMNLAPRTAEPSGDRPRLNLQPRASPAPATSPQPQQPAAAMAAAMVPAAEPAVPATRAPGLNLAGAGAAGKPTWREREAARIAAGGAPASDDRTPPPSAPAPAAGGKWVPRSRAGRE